MGRPRVSEADPQLRRRGRPRKNDTGNTSGRTGFDGYASAPWRKTVSIFKQPVTLVHTTRPTKDGKKPTATQLARGAGGRQEKPVQLMWPKSLEGLAAVLPLRVADKCAVNGETLESTLDLPAKFEPAITPLISTAAAAASLCTAIHNAHTLAVTGQKMDVPAAEANPKNSLMDTEQPCVKAVAISEEDIKAQERRVIDARKRLQEIRKHLFTPT